MRLGGKERRQSKVMCTVCISLLVMLFVAPTFEFFTKRRHRALSNFFRMSFFSLFHRTVRSTFLKTSKELFFPFLSDFSIYFNFLGTLDAYTSLRLWENEAEVLLQETIDCIKKKKYRTYVV